MADIKCAVCEEPWDSWGANHGDMKAWEYELLREGAGCPCCQGESDCNPDEALIGHLRSVVFGGTDDPDSFKQLHNVSGDLRPKWKEPEPKKLWTCDGCGVSVVVSNEVPLDGADVSKNPIWLEWHGGEKVHYYGGYAYAYGGMNNCKEPNKEYIELDGKKYCPGCAAICPECREAVLLIGGHHIFDSCEDLGYPFPHPNHPFYGDVCYDCMLELEMEEEEAE